jgi:alcohol dehydrogenase/S-(hydroxymethyl)glutathione dehydrogenase/alcohol dehydrogenase
MSSHVTAAVLRKSGEPLDLVDVLLDDPLDNEVVVRTERAGLCHSDLHYLDGSLGINLPAVLGHEVAGIVERVGGSVTRVAPGDRVVATVTPACGLCDACLRGRPTQCLRADQVRQRARPKLVTGAGEVVTPLAGLGAFAEAFIAAESALAPVDASVPPEVACLLGCCISTGVGAVIHGAGIGVTSMVVVIGCGGVGIAALQGARLAGARRIVAVDAVTEKLDVARRFGATDTLLADKDPELTTARLLELVPGGFTDAIEAVGRRETARLAFDVLAPTGTATILGLMREGERLSISADALVYGDRRLQGAYMGANRFLSDVDVFVDHYRSGRLDLDGMVSAVVPLERINDGFAAMTEPGTVRVVLDLMGGSR